MNLIRKCLALFWERPVGGICCLIAVAALPGIRQGQCSSSRMFLIQKLRRVTLPWQITSRMDETVTAYPTGSRARRSIYPPNVVAPIEPGYYIALKELQSSICTNF